jgi:hypothetical protein
VDIFISYCHQDRNVAVALESGLRALGFSVWRDVGQMRAGQSLGSEIEQAIQSAVCVVACLSSASVQSGWVRAEMRRARGKLIPVKIGRFDTTIDLDADLGGVFYRDLTPWIEGTSSTPWEDLAKDCLYRVKGVRQQGMSVPLPPPGSKPDVAAVTVHNSGSVGTIIGRLRGNVTIGKAGVNK